MSHLAVRSLMERGFVSGVVTSNHDRLQHRAFDGATADRPDIGELFGNALREVCTDRTKCGAVYQRHTSVPALGRKCEKCGARLVRSGVRYGEYIQFLIFLNLFFKFVFFINNRSNNSFGKH